MRLLAIGGCLVDSVARSSVPFEAGTSCPGTVQRFAGGVARNVAVLAASKGHGTGLVTAVGDDSDGVWLLGGVKAKRVDAGRSLVAKGARTGTYVAVHDDKGAMVAAVVDMAVFDRLTADHLASVLPPPQKAGLVFADANLSAAALAFLAGVYGPALAVDAVSRTKATRLEAVLGSDAMLFMNRREAETLCSTAFVSAEDASAALLARGVNRAIITDGARPAALIEHGRCYLRPVGRVPVVDETGAGDALIAGTLAAILAGASLTAALEQGTTAAQHALGVSGALDRLP